MSTATSTRALPAAPGALRAASLRLVPQRRSSAAKAPFVVAVVVLLVGGLLGLLLLNTVVAQDAFRLHDLQKQGRVLGDREQALAKQVQALQAPGSISDRAIALGMVSGGVPVFLRLPDGAVLGAATAPGSAPAPVRPAAPAATGPAVAAAAKPTAGATAAKPTAAKPTAARPTAATTAAKPTAAKPTAGTPAAKPAPKVASRPPRQPSPPPVRGGHG